MNLFSRNYLSNNRLWFSPKNKWLLILSFLIKSSRWSLEKIWISNEFDLLFRNNYSRSISLSLFWIVDEDGPENVDSEYIFVSHTNVVATFIRRVLEQLYFRWLVKLTKLWYQINFSLNFGWSRELLQNATVKQVRRVRRVPTGLWW